MRVLLNRIVESVSYDKEVSKELTNLARNLKSVDRSPDEELPQDQANTILGKIFHYIQILAASYRFS